MLNFKLTNMFNLSKGFSKAIFIFPALLILLQTAQAANFSILPSGGSHYSNFNAGVYVKSPTQSVNAYSGTISFNQDKLRVVSISTAGSIVGQWLQGPTFSNTAGTISFEGYSTSPFQGALGKIFDINFAVNGLGAAPVLMAQGQILANDGAGTNVATPAENASYIIVVAPPAPPKPVVTPKPAPAPVISGAKPSAPIIVQSEVSEQSDMLIVSGTFDKGNILVVFIESEEDYYDLTCNTISPEGVVREEVRMGESTSPLRIFLLSCGSLLELTPESSEVTDNNFSFNLREGMLDGKYNFWVKSMNSALLYSDESGFEPVSVDFDPKPAFIGLRESTILIINLAFLAALIIIFLIMAKIAGFKTVAVLKRDYQFAIRVLKKNWNKLTGKSR